MKNNQTIAGIGTPAAAGFLFILLDLLLGGPLTTILDPFINTYMKSLPHIGFDVAIAGILDHIGKITVIAPVLGIAALYVSHKMRTWQPFLLTAGTLLMTLVITASLKFSLERGFSINGNPALFVPDSHAFPSGHASQIAVGASLLLVLYMRLKEKDYSLRRQLTLVFALSTVQVFVSLYLGYHWATDLAAGLLLGLFCVRAGLRVEQWWESRDDKRDDLLTRANE